MDRGGESRGRSGGGGGGDCAGASGGDDGRLGLSEQPLDGLAVGAVTQFARQLEYAGCAERRHSDAAAAAVHLGVTVSGARERESRHLGFGCGGFGRGSNSGGGGGGSGGGCGRNLLCGVLLGEVENHV